MKIRIALILIVICLAGCKTPSLDLGSTEPRIDAPLIVQLNEDLDTASEGEASIELPEEALVRQRMALGVARNDTLETYANSILEKLQKAWPGDNPPSHVFFVPSAEFSAFYSDGGIFVAHGLIRKLESEDELAALLAHEYAHALLEHDVIASASELANRVYGTANMYLHVKFGTGDTGGMIEQYLLNRAVNEASQSALLPAFSREQEDEADSLGTDLLIRAGYNPIAMTYLLQRVADWETRNEKIAEKRRVQLSEMIKSSMASTGSNNSFIVDISLDHIFQTIGADLEKAYAELQKQHYPAEEREIKVKEYIREYYAEVPRDTLKEKEIRTALNKADAARFIKGLERLDETDQACQKQQVKKAKKYMARTDKGLYQNVAYARHLSLEVKRMASDAKLEDLEANCQEPDSLLIDHERLIMHYEQDDPAKALEVADRAYEEFDEPARMLPTLIRLHKLNEGFAHNVTAVALYTACVANGDPQLHNMCMQAINGMPEK